MPDLVFNFSMINEDDRDYCDGWTEKTSVTENLPSCQKQVNACQIGRIFVHFFQGNY
jgi:hypothetical protein